MNDIFYFIEKSDIYKYADDNSLSVADIDIDTIIDNLQHDINILGTWFDDNSMSLNNKKCQFLIIESLANSRQEIKYINAADNNIEESKECKLLGIKIDNNITMVDHIKGICNIAGNKLNALARISKYLDENKRKLLMKSFIISQFQYCPIIWMYCQRRSNNLINRIHERALRIAYNDYISDFDSLLKKDNTVTIHQRNIQTLAVEIYKSLNELGPKLMNEILYLKENTPNTRKQQLVYPNPHTVTYGLETFGYKAAHIWSSLPNDIQKTNNINIFKEFISSNCSKLCNCNICTTYVANLGYVNIS